MDDDDSDRLVDDGGEAVTPAVAIDRADLEDIELGGIVGGAATAGDQDDDRSSHAADSTDGPGHDVLNGTRSFASTDGRIFGRFFNGANHTAESVRSSNASINMEPLRHLPQFDILTFPTCEKEMGDFARSISDAYRRSSHLRDALLSSWVWADSSYACPDGNGNTLIHVAVKMDLAKLVSVLVGLNSGDLVNARNGREDTPLHVAAEFNRDSIVDILVKLPGIDLEARNALGLTPLQVAAITLHRESCSALLKSEADFKVMTPKKETVLHLACKGHWARYQRLKEELNEEIAAGVSVEQPDGPEGDASGGNFLWDLQETNRRERERLCSRSFATLGVLLEAFKETPNMMQLEDDIDTSPGTVLHYFSCFNYVDGTKTLLSEPFHIFPSMLNKNKVSPLLIAAFLNHTTLGTLLLKSRANAGDCKPDDLVTPLHHAIYGYHISRVDETCSFVAELLSHGADPTALDASGETPAHLAVGTLDFRVMSKFTSHLGPECLDLKDSSGNTFFHYAIGSLDENSIYALIELGANLMSRNSTEVDRNEEDAGDEGEDGGRVDESVVTNGTVFRGSSSRTKLRRSRSIVIQRLPLQEAIKNGNGKNYFNAIRRLNFESVLSRWDAKEQDEFLCSHLLAATREVRPDIVRLLFLQIQETPRLHRILLYCDKSHDDETFTKTALEWAVENNDRLCTTEILHQEFECHRASKVAGLSCLRRQIHGDELLVWTIETFTMFYDKTFAQRTILPVFGLLPLLLSIASFVYDYYSDLELTMEYFDRSTVNVSYCQLKLHNCDASYDFIDSCVDFERTPTEYHIAFVTNVIWIALPMLVFGAMCARELLPYVMDMDRRLRKQQETTGCPPKIIYLAVVLLFLYPIWLVVSIVCAPFFILFVAARQVYFKFRHRRAKRKNLFRRQLQKSEYLWGVSRTAEAGLESCGQLVLQLWLLSSSFKSLADDTFLGVAARTYHGVVFFLTFSYREADEIEKSLGKIFMSVVALVLGVSACYRTLKRGAIKASQTGFIYASLLLQVLARIFSLSLYFFAVREFLPAVPIWLGIHFLLVFILKWSLELADHNRGGLLSKVVAVVNVLASSLVFVRVVPIAKQDSRSRKEAKVAARLAGLHHEHNHGTFLVQSVFFLLALVENLLLASTPLFYSGGANRAMECLGVERLRAYVAAVLGLCAASWFCHVLYYKYLGHPWSDINGPVFSWNGFSFNFHLFGRERLFDWWWRRRKRTAGEEEEGGQTVSGSSSVAAAAGGADEGGQGTVTCCGKGCAISCRVVDEDEDEEDGLLLVA